MGTGSGRKQEIQKRTVQVSSFDVVYEIVIRIPHGKVLTYGAISKRINGRLSAAAVGWAMNALGSTKSKSKHTSQTVPWHRVINSKGALSTHHESGFLAKDGRPVKLQQVLLEKEGVRFSDAGTVDLGQYLWIE